MRRFIASESAGGVVLAIAAVIALVVSNSALGPGYERFVQMRGEVRIGDDWLVLSKPLLLWVNDLWMAVFFFHVGLEIKREVLTGELASLKQASLPAVAALGGMIVPALIYVVLNHADAVALRGWAAPFLRPARHLYRGPRPSRGARSTGWAGRFQGTQAWQ